MIACVSPALDDFPETYNTVKYAARARRIRNKPVINRDPQLKLILELQEEIAQLRKGPASSGAVERVRRWVLKHHGIEVPEHVLSEGASDLLTTPVRARSPLRCEFQTPAPGPELPKRRPSEQQMVEGKKRRTLHVDVAEREEGPLAEEDPTATLAHAVQTVLELNPAEVDLLARAAPESLDKQELLMRQCAEYHSKGLDLSVQVERVDRAMLNKKELITALQGETQAYDHLKQDYEGRLAEVESKLKCSETERDRLTKELRTAGAGPRVQLAKDLQVKQKEVDGKQREVACLRNEFRRVERLRADREGQIKELESELQALKVEKVQLSKKLKDQDQWHRKILKEKDSVIG